MKLTGIFIGTIIGNYLYQMLGGPHDYIAAFERSYFMGLTLLSVWLVDNFPRTKPSQSK